MNKLKVLQDLNRIESRLNKSTQPNLSVDLDNFEFTILNADKEIIYRPIPTILELHKSDAPVRCVMGPFGSGKSSGACAEILFRAITMPQCKDGKRRSKWIIIRNTSGELETTSLQLWLEWFDQLGGITSHKKPVMEYRHIFKVAGVKGTIELDLIFLALDRPADLRKLKSLPATAAYLNEVSELPEEIFPFVKGRLGRYPSKLIIDEEYWSGIIADTNPPDVDGWFYKLFEVKRPGGYLLFKQPPGLVETDDGEYITNVNAENIKNLPNPNYYTDMARGETKEFVKVYCMGQYGTVIFGKKIFENYNDDLHAVENLDSDVEKDSILMLGWDFGLTPACLIAQLTSSGRLIVLKEFCTERSCVRDLAVDVVLPYLNSKYKGYPYISVGDPSDSPSDSTNKSCMQILKECGITTSKAITNDIIPRIDSVNQYLSKIIDGRASFTISKENCPILRQGFLGRYNYKRLQVIGEARFRDMPDKTHPYSDIQDCLQYICLEFCNKTKQNIELDKDFFKAVPAWC